MSAAEFLKILQKCDTATIIPRIAELSNQIRTCFLQITYSNEEQLLVENILSEAINKVTNHDKRKTDEFQGLITHLGYYFIKVRRSSAVAQCLLVIETSSLKYRLKAFVFYNQYTNVSQHISLFERLLKLYSSSLEDEFEDYSNEVLNDLFDYKKLALSQFAKYGKPELIDEFNALFVKEDYVRQYPLLNLFQLNQFVYSHTTTIQEYKGKIYEPSVFSAQLFDDKFISPIKADSRTDWYKILLGYDGLTIRSEIINFGQTNFDGSYKDLNSAEIVKLYCFFNMRKHFFSSLSLFERFPVLINHYSKTGGRLKFIDVGCGPATSGIALVDYLQKLTGDKVIFDYYGIDFYHSMLNAADNIMTNEKFDKKNGAVELITSFANFKNFWLNNATCIIFNTCYLFASDSLDEQVLADDINKLRANHPFVPAFLFFQNTTDPAKNLKYTRFKTKLKIQKIEYSDKVKIYYNNKRNNSFPPTDETVYFEVLSL